MASLGYFTNKIQSQNRWFDPEDCYNIPFSYDVCSCLHDSNKLQGFNVRLLEYEHQKNTPTPIKTEEYLKFPTAEKTTNTKYILAYKKDNDAVL